MTRHRAGAWGLEARDSRRGCQSSSKDMNEERSLHCVDLCWPTRGLNLSKIRKYQKGRTELGTKDARGEKTRLMPERLTCQAFIRTLWQGPVITIMDSRFVMTSSAQVAHRQSPSSGEIRSWLKPPRPKLLIVGDNLRRRASHGGRDAPHVQLDLNSRKMCRVKPLRLRCLTRLFRSIVPVCAFCSH